jgi:hypothetical protein
VCNQTDREEYGGPEGFFDDCGRFPREWQDARVVSNGCQRAREWQGHVSDLKAALDQISAAGNGHLDTLVIDANLYLWPTFNFQVRKSVPLAVVQFPGAEVTRCCSIAVLLLLPLQRCYAIAALQAACKPDLRARVCIGVVWMAMGLAAMAMLAVPRTDA